MRILVAESQPKVRHALLVLLEHQPGLEVAGEASNDTELLALVREIRPDVVLLHWMLRGRSAVELLPDLRTAHPSLAMIVLSGRSDVEEQALAAGADAFVSKGDPPEQLLKTITMANRVRTEWLAEDQSFNGTEDETCGAAPKANAKQSTTQRTV